MYGANVAGSLKWLARRHLEYRDANDGWVAISQCQPMLVLYDIRGLGYGCYTKKDLHLIDDDHRATVYVYPVMMIVMLNWQNSRRSSCNTCVLERQYAHADAQTKQCIEVSSPQHCF
ncbi:hypothetical protein NXS19_007441 [Fusarium pseudograminearum]|nr:hypothetical protein NXS19_007441 [Fusarium pseudograminearum]